MNIRNMRQRFLAISMLLTGMCLAAVAQTQTAGTVLQIIPEDHGLTGDPATLEAGHLWGDIEGVKFSNPFEVRYKGTSINSFGFSSVSIDGNVIATERGVQGDINPKDADGAAPANSLLPPFSGSVIQIDAKKDGWVYIVAMISGNKAYTVFEEGQPLGYKIASYMPSEVVPDNVLNLEIKGDDEYNYITSGRMIGWVLREYLGDSEARFTDRGIGVIYFPVYSGRKYLVCANGSKIAWSGACFSPTEAQSVVLSSSDGVTAPVELVKPKSGETVSKQMFFRQDHEEAANPYAAGWSSPHLAGGLSFASQGELGRYLEFSLWNNNTRSAQLSLENAKLGEQQLTSYTVEFQWGYLKNATSIGNNANVQYINEVALISKGAYKYTNNVSYAENDSMRIFSLSQVKGAYHEGNPYWTDRNDNNNNTQLFCVNGVKADAFQLTEGAWYDVSVTIDPQQRTVLWTISSADGKMVKSGTCPIAEKCNLLVSDLNILAGRYESIAGVDNVKVFKQVAGDYANAPIVALTNVDQSLRGYRIDFEEGETLFYKTPDGLYGVAMESPFFYETSTSGTLEAWTKKGCAFSEHIKTDVDATVCQLPQPSYDIKSTTEGYKKTYAIYLDNSQVPLRPELTFTYTFTDANGNISEYLQPMASGSEINVTEKGTLTVTVSAKGYASSTITIDNNTEYTLSEMVDFQHMTAEELLQKGFTEIEPLQTAMMTGEENWTARQRLWFGIADGGTDGEGKPTYTKHVVYGPAETVGAEALRRFEYKPSKLTKELATSLFSPVTTWYAGTVNPNVTDGSNEAAIVFYMGIGLTNDGYSGDNRGPIRFVNAPISFQNLTENDYVMVYTIKDYGSSSLHPLFPAGTSVEEARAQYKAMNLGDGYNPMNLTPDKVAVRCMRGSQVYQLYRIDTAITRVEIYKVKQPEPELAPVIQGDAVSFAESETITEQTDLSSTVVDNMYYSISADAGGYDASEGCIVINKETSDKKLEELGDKGLSNGMFNSQFTGIVFKLPAGTGTVKVNAETTGSMLLKVRIGDGQPLKMSLAGRLTMEVPYDLDEPTYIYIYAGTDETGAARVRAAGDASQQDACLKIYGIEWDCKPLKGDANGDGVVNVADLILMVRHMVNGNAEGIVMEAADTNGNQKIDEEDIEAVVSRILMKK